MTMKMFLLYPCFSTSFLTLWQTAWALENCCTAANYIRPRAAKNSGHSCLMTSCSSLTPPNSSHLDQTNSSIPTQMHSTRSIKR